jgi:hypothetical protein
VPGIAPSVVQQRRALQGNRNLQSLSESEMEHKASIQSSQEPDSGPCPSLGFCVIFRKMMFLGEIWGSHGGEYEDDCLSGKLHCVI